MRRRRACLAGRVGKWHVAASVCRPACLEARGEPASCLEVGEPAGTELGTELGCHEPAAAALVALEVRGEEVGQVIGVGHATLEEVLPRRIMVRGRGAGEVAQVAEPAFHREARRGELGGAPT